MNSYKQHLNIFEALAYFLLIKQYLRLIAPCCGEWLRTTIHEHLYLSLSVWLFVVHLN